MAMSTMHFFNRFLLTKGTGVDSALLAGDKATAPHWRWFYFASRRVATPGTLQRHSYGAVRYAM